MPPQRLTHCNRRARSGREVRDFLRSLGLCLDSPAAVIKQAAVTRLSDANSPSDLAAVVAEASGLGELVLHACTHAAGCSCSGGRQQA